MNWLVLLATFTVGLQAAETSLQNYLELTNGQLEHMREIQRQLGIRFPESTFPRGLGLPETSSLLTADQRTKLPSLNEAMQRWYARQGAISAGLIAAPPEPSSCYCVAETYFIAWLGLDSEQAALVHGHRLHAGDLTAGQKLRFALLAERPVLTDTAREAGRLNLIPDPEPHGECLCP